MRPLELAKRYMELFFSGSGVEGLKDILAEDMTFEGPFFRFDSAEGYIDSLRSDPPKEMSYEMIRSFENGPSACLVYRFTKPGVSTPMAQFFEVEGDKIQKILLVFDGRAFA